MWYRDVSDTGKKYFFNESTGEIRLRKSGTDNNNDNKKTRAKTDEEVQEEVRKKRTQIAARLRGYTISGVREEFPIPTDGETDPFGEGDLFDPDMSPIAVRNGGKGASRIRNGKDHELDVPCTDILPPKQIVQEEARRRRARLRNLATTAEEEEEEPPRRAQQQRHSGEDDVPSRPFRTFKEEALYRRDENKDLRLKLEQVLGMFARLQNEQRLRQAATIAEGKTVV